MNTNNIIESSIIDLLKNNPRGMSQSQIARSLESSAATVSKYLMKLELLGQIDKHIIPPAHIYFIDDEAPKGKVEPVSEVPKNDGTVL
ncbi:winged helix-turn-helix transcriptional regulator [Candidatus Woesearchaeota archaeon]|nr:winged helix-turn-helix transcriptional regulator [Candidatus Woesearchaeota archaeon]